MDFKIAVIEGDGIGPEIVREALKVMDTVGKKFGHNFEYKKVLMGGCAIDATGVPLPQETIDECLKSDSVLLGAVGGPKWDTLPGHLRPEAGLLGIRGALKLFANLRPARLYDALKDACPLKDTGGKMDIMIVRELTGGIYFGERGRTADGEEAFDTERYSKKEIARIVKVACDLAKKRGTNKIISVDKANVLESSRLWREVAHKTAEENGIEITDMLVDNAAMQLVKNPAQFDVMVTSNIFGDILSDEASMITGSIGMLPSASLGEGKLGLYEPIHGSAPDIQGQNKANPIATILSVAMMFRYSLDLFKEADAIENAVEKILNEGYRTVDIKGSGDVKVLSTTEMGGLICQYI